MILLSQNKVFRADPNYINPLMPGGNKRVVHIYTNLQLKAADLLCLTFLLPPGIKG